MKEPTKEQVLDALQTHKTVQKAAKALGLSYPKMQHWLKKYGIVCNHNAKIMEEQKRHAWSECAAAYFNAVNERLHIARMYHKLFKKGE